MTPELAQPLRVVYFGTPSFAVPSLERLASLSEFNIRLVVTQPDRPAGRGRRLTASPVKLAAERLGVPLYQPASLRTPDLRDPIAHVDADLFVVAAYGVIFGPKTLALPRIGSVNIHASLLPRYRGASPISAAIASGDEVSGVSLMVMDLGLDTGPVISHRSIPIESVETTGSLTDRLAMIGADLVAADLLQFAAGALSPVPQPETSPSVTRPLSKADGWVDWNAPAATIERHVRAMWPWPRAWTTLDDTIVQIHKSRILDAIDSGGIEKDPGTVVAAGTTPAVVCGDGRQLAVDVIQRAGGRPAPGTSLLGQKKDSQVVTLGMSGRPEGAGIPPVIPH